MEGMEGVRIKAWRFGFHWVSSFVGCASLLMPPMSHPSLTSKHQDSASCRRSGRYPSSAEGAGETSRREPPQELSLNQEVEARKEQQGKDRNQGRSTNRGKTFREGEEIA